MNQRQKLVQKQFLNNEETVIKRLEYIYDKALSDVNANIRELEFKIGDLTEQYDWMEDDDPAKEVVRSKIQSKIYQKQYQQQLKDQVDGVLNQMKTKQFVTVSDYLDTCYEDGFIGSLFDLHGQDVPLIMPIDQTKMVRAVQLDSKISKGLYTKLGEDVDVLKKRITSEVSRSISTGSSFEQTAKRLAGQSKIGYNKAVRIARTEGHRIQTTAAMDVMEQAKQKGADVVKQWDATLDDVTRESHVAVDGEIREVDKKFSNGLMYPGDPGGGAAEVVNCRCALLQRARWALDEGELQTLKDRAEYFGLDKTEQFDDFKVKYLNTELRQIDAEAIPPKEYDGVFDDFAELHLAKEESAALSTLWSSTNETGHEYGVVIDNGVVGKPMTSGLPNAVKIPLDGYGTGLTVLHSHTNATPPSITDFQRLLDKKIDKIGVIGYNADVYMVFVGDGEIPSIDDFMETASNIGKAVDFELIDHPNFFDWTIEERNYMAIREQAFRIAQHYGWVLEGGRINVE